MIVTEVYATRGDGVKLYRSYSASGMMIHKDGTDEIYTEAIDVEDVGFTYTETDIPVAEPTGDLTVQDALDMLNELGVDTDD